MNLHQVLTGAVNPGDHCFSVGSVGDQRFTAYASGCDVVILGSNFERLQIIPGAKHGNIQVGCVDCSMQQGKIAASYGNIICVFEPVNLLKQKNTSNELYNQWQKSGQFFLESIAHNITWDPTGSRLLTGSSCLQLWSNNNLEKQSEDENPEKTDLNFGDWRCIWQCRTASQVHLMRFSPDGEFFATAGKDDCLLKVWYNTDSWRSTVTSQDRGPEKQTQGGEVDFSFVYLAHPRAVNGFSWRKTSKYMPRASVCNVLLTCCKDNVCRLWVETFLPNDSLLYEGNYNHWTDPVNLTNNFKRNASSKERVQNALEVNLRHFRRGRRRSLALVAHTGYLPHQQNPHQVHRNTPLQANALCHFHIAASINPATDIPLLPSITSLSLGENEEKSGPFVVHWLNNKELHFTLSMEVFLQQLRKSFEQPPSETSMEESNQVDGKSDEETDDGVDDLKAVPEKRELSSEKNIPSSGCVPLPSAIIDHQIEVLLSEWSKNADMLFSIHPVDGSLLIWHVDWLDEYQPGMFRQVQVSFVSRIPVAFPTGDANSLCRSIVMYACTKNVDLAIQQGKQKPSGLTRSTSMLISSGHSKSTNSLKLSIFTPNVMMISKHADGSLNQWLVSFAEESAFSTVLSISHKSRYCGHRFHLNDLACHSVLPLLLTTSHHNALRTPDIDNQKQPYDTLNSEEISLGEHSRSTVDVTFQDPNAVYSELILWRVDPVGPLSFSGGVSELARINSLHVSAFSNVAWLPTLIPSYCLGAYCNSPSACFVASDGQYLRLYEAVTDAKKLLYELSNPEISKYVGEVFNIVSQQSTARPGCIIELDPITELHGRKTQLLHVFQEDFILNSLEKKSLGKGNILSDSGKEKKFHKEREREVGVDQGMASFTCNPAVFNFYNYLRTHPLLLRRHFGSSDASSTQICLTGENGLAGKINLCERRLFFTTAHAHLKAGCPMLALEVLSKMPKVIKKTKLFYRTCSFPDTSKDCSPSSPLRLDTKDYKSSSIDWSECVINGLRSSSDGLSDKQSNSTLSFDWSQPSVVFKDESLDLKWDSDNDEENEDTPLSMKELKPSQIKVDEKINETNSSYTDSFSTDESDILSPSEDVIAVQLKFRACLKILTIELRTLSTGYEIDGGKLRYQLYHWLEKEVVALQKACDYCSDVEDVQSVFSENMDEAILNENTKDLFDQPKVNQLRDNFQKRRQWLLKYQSLLRMFLSYCILHGSHGGGLASVRMELILLLQESQQETLEPIFPGPLPDQTSIPLLFACTASAKTVVANPLLHLSNLTHDILYAIINLDSPPHPDTQNNKVYVMHTLAASLSACIYQCLCGGHNYSSLQTNQFTGMVYQTLLFPHQHCLKTSLDETITPNTSPAQWPGITALIRLLNSAGEEAQSGLTVLLCEILTAVYLSLFIHGLATHSSNVLFRIVAHPLNEKMWSAVFGGGAHIPSKEQTSSKAVTVSSPAEDGEKQHKRSRPSRTSSKECLLQNSSSPRGEQESLTYKEKFIPPELSIWDYFIAKPFLPPSQSRAEYDSEESQESGDDEDEDGDEDVLTSDYQLQEHANSNSYSWSLMRLAMVQLVLYNLKTFYPLAGHDLSELPVSSPLCHAVLKALQCWEQVLLRRLEIHGGPPQNYISIHTSEESLSGGPAILRHKALLEPTNTPFKSKHHLALSVKRLWQYLVKQEEIQETFIRNIFTKKRCLNESLEDHSETIKNSIMEEPNFNKIEAELGFPGGKARIIHKESDIITAFAVNRANRNCIAIASSHDIQELDVSGILATQIYTWVDDEIELETKGSDDFLVIHARDDLASVQGTTPYTHSNPGTPINMPWLGSTQTGRGASVVSKNNISNCFKTKKILNLCPLFYKDLTGAQDGSVRMFEWGHSQQITCFRSGGNSRVTRMRFNHQGNKFGIVDADGYISLYQTNWKCCPVTGNTPKPYLTWQCHNKTANDFVFISSSSLIATAGLSTDNRNICLWDTLVAPANSLVHPFTCHDSGATVLAYAPKHQVLISGGRKGFTSVFDLRQRQQRQFFQSHDSPVKAIAVDPTEEYFVTGSAEGNIKIWSLSTFNLLHTFINEHARQSIFRNIGTGVMQIETGPANHIFSCGADGTVKMRILPDRFSPLNEMLKNDVKFML
uniref:Dmx like 1 n=1 Tax=Vombatus ursinus TaxID=29139 RepID=A0A4X2KS97_VOMUR